jgi:hypothetical protein
MLRPKIGAPQEIVSQEKMTNQTTIAHALKRAAGEKVALIVFGSALLGGCAQLVFKPEPRDDALKYRDSVPYLWVTTNKDCT